MKKRTARTLKKILASILTVIFFLTSPLMSKAYAWQQPQPPSTYLNPSQINANNPDPLTDAVSKVGQSPFGQLTSGLPKNGPNKPGSVDIALGRLSLNDTDVKIPSNGFPLNFQRSYNSGNTVTGPFGIGWDFTYNRYITMYADYAMLEHCGGQSDRTYNYTKNDPSIHISSFDGSDRVQYPLDNGYYTPTQPANTSQLTRNPDVTYTAREKDGTTYKYNKYQQSWATTQDPMNGKLIQISDRNNNSMTFQYDGQGNLTQITDTGGRATTLAYTGSLCTSVTDPLGRTTTYQYDGNNRLVSVTDPAGGQVSYTYDANNRIVSITDAAGSTYTYNYDDSGRVITVTNPDGIAVETYNYQPDQKQTTVTRPGNRITSYTYDSNNNITQITDPLGNTTTSTWTPCATGLLIPIRSTAPPPTVTTVTKTSPA